jgi:hypothetical protein
MLLLYALVLYRPSKEDETATLIRDAESSPVSVTVVQGDGVVEVRQVFASWAKQTVRLREHSNAVELEFAVVCTLYLRIMADTVNSLNICRALSQWTMDSVAK